MLIFKDEVEGVTRQSYNTRDILNSYICRLSIQVVHTSDVSPSVAAFELEEMKKEIN